MELKKTAKLDFPKVDPANPEIDRMWASHRIDGLLKQADRTGSRSGVTDEVIKLGEGYSIVTEYTSFLVLENDGEYQRWKIDRRNALRTDRDRKAQELVRADLEKLRNKALTGLGPQQEIQLASNKPMIPSSAASPAPATQSAPPATSAPTPNAKPQRNQSFDLGLGGGGSGPVGPLFVVGLLALRRLRNRNARA